MTAPLTPRAGQPEPFIIRLYDALCRFAERQALREMMVRRSDRLLTDIGFSRETFATEIEAAIAGLQARRETERRVLRELRRCDDRELQDMGISRLDIRRVARAQAKQAMESRRAEVSGQSRAA